jgi:hypothetical protein
LGEQSGQTLLCSIECRDVRYVELLLWAIVVSPRGVP